MQAVPMSQQSFPLVMAVASQFLSTWYSRQQLLRISIVHQDETICHSWLEPHPLGCQYYPGCFPTPQSSSLQCWHAWDFWSQAHLLLASLFSLLSSTWVSWGQVCLRHNNSKIRVMEAIVLGILKSLETESSLCQPMCSEGLPSSQYWEEPSEGENWHRRQAWFPVSWLSSWRERICCCEMTLRL